LAEVRKVLTVSIIIVMVMEAVSTPETSVNFYQSTRRNIPEDSHFNLEPKTHFDIIST
jgi:hypothetical protein